VQAHVQVHLSETWLGVSLQWEGEAAFLADAKDGEFQDYAS
jgi:hypothetical protein